MSKHRASNCSSVRRIAPIGAGLTIAALAAGSGSAFASAETVVPVQKPTCQEATTALSGAQSDVLKFTGERDSARRTLGEARSNLAKAQRPYDDAVRSRDAAEDRLESAEKRQSGKQKAFDIAKARAASYPSRSAQRDLARATSALNDAKFETTKAHTKFVEKQKAMPAKPDTTALSQKVADAKAALETAEKALAVARGERRDARTVRDDACTAGVTTLG